MEEVVGSIPTGSTETKGGKPALRANCPFMRIRTSFVLLLALIASVLPFTTAVADPVPEDAEWTQVYFPSEDGTMLHADVFLPKDREKNERHPVILSIGPYFGSGGSAPPTPTREGPVMRFQDLIDEGKIFKRGYAYIQVDSRGYGGSDGCYDLGGAGEQMDATSAVEWAAEQPWSNGRVGMWGKSYDAWTQVMALAHKPKGLEAAIVQSPLIEGYKGFFMNGVHYDAGWYATPGLYGDYDLTPPSANDSPPEEFIYPAKGTATNPDCYANNGTQAAIGDHSTDYWMERDIREAAGASTVPVLWSHGFLDANTKPDNFMDVWTALQGPKRGWFGQYDHVRGNEDKLVGRDGFMDEAMAWLDHYLKGMPLKRFPATEIQDSNGEWRKEAAWPPRDAKLHRFRLKPGEYTDDPIQLGRFTRERHLELHPAGALRPPFRRSPRALGRRYRSTGSSEPHRTRLRRRSQGRGAAHHTRRVVSRGGRAAHVPALSPGLEIGQGPSIRRLHLGFG